MPPIKTLTERRAEKVAQMRAAVDAIRAELRNEARRRGWTYVLYGSAATGELRPQSDVDIMVDAPEAELGAARRFAETACGRRGLYADVRPRIWCSDRLLARIAQEGEVLA